MNKIDISASKTCCRRNVANSKEGLQPSVMLFNQKYFTLLHLTAVKALRKGIAMVIVSGNTSGFWTPLLHVSLAVDLHLWGEIETWSPLKSWYMHTNLSGGTAPVPCDTSHQVNVTDHVSFGYIRFTAPHLDGRMELRRNKWILHLL